MVSNYRSKSMEERKKCSTLTTSVVLHRGHNSCQNSCDTNAIARQNDALLPRRPGAVFTVCIPASFFFFQHNQNCLAERETSEIGFYKNIPKLLKEVEYELILQSVSPHLFSSRVPKVFSPEM